MNRILLSQKLEAQMAALEEQIQHFRLHLVSGKFTGTEIERHRCQDCGGIVEVIEGKDWISTADVERWLAEIVSLTRVER